jgi:hypothetical protein
MKLRDIIDAVASTSDDMCIVARRPWHGDSDARLVQLDADGGLPPHARADGYEYFLELSVILEDVLSPATAVLTPDQKFGLVLYFAENDAYPEWVFPLVEPQDSRGSA